MHRPCTERLRAPGLRLLPILLLSGTLGAPALAQPAAPAFPNAIHIERADIERLLIGEAGDDLEDVATLLSLYAGITFRNTGDPGAETWLIVRNFGRDNSRLILILLDGRPLNLSNNHTVELDDVPLGLVDRITVYPGPVPARYGGYHAVIDIRTLPPSELASATLGVGSLGTTRASALAGGTGRLHWRLSADLETSDGRTGEELAGPLAGFTYGDRSVRTVLASGRVGYALAPWLEATARLEVVNFRKAFDSAPLFGRDAARERGTQTLVLQLTPPATGTTPVDFEAVLFHAWEQETLNPIFPEDVTYNVHWGSQRRSITGIGARAERALAPTLALGAGADAAWTRGRTDDDYVYFQFADRQAFYGAFVEATARPWTGATLYAGLRLDGQQDAARPGLGPRLALEQRLADGLGAYAAWGISTRRIPLNEVNTFRRPPRVLGPPFLQAPGVVSLPEHELALERMNALEVGLRGRVPGLPVSGRMAFFALANRGAFGAPAFEIRPVAPGAAVPPGFEAALVAADRNFPGRDVNRGLELDLVARLHPAVEASASLTRFLTSATRPDDDIALYTGPVGGPDAQAALNASIGQFVIPSAGRTVSPGAYRWLGHVNLTVTPSDAVALLGRARYRGETDDPIMKFGADPGVATIPASLVADVGVRYTLPVPGARVNASLSVSNLFDTTYETFVHYPMPGRFLMAGLSVSTR